MGRIVAIGGGEIKDGETLNIDKFIVSLSGKERPSLLFIPTASHDAEGYIETVKKVYGELGCDVKILCLTKENIEEILNILENIIYENSMIYNSIYRIIIETRRRVKINCNFEMTKDYLILNIWDEINK